MISSLQPFVQQLKQYPQFQTISAVEGFCDSLKPTTKRVLSCLISNPQSEGERDARSEARSIAHTCGPLLEIPSTYANYVDLREDFMNILNRTTGKWILYERNAIGLSF